MCPSATCQPWHQEYAFIGWIPTGISVAVLQIRALWTAFNATEPDWRFAADFPEARSPVDFR
jgi:hypothetical protein